MAIEWGVWFEPIQPIRRLVELAQQAERLGAATCFVADEGTDRDLYVALTAILMNTERVIVAPSITNPLSRHPVTTAAAVASLAELAPGRVWHGLGSGGTRVLHPLGIVEDKPYTKLRDAVDINRRLLAGEEVGAAQLPWAPGRIPLMIAGRGPRVMKLAATQAEWVLLSSKSHDEIAPQVEGIRSLGDTKIALAFHLAYNGVERRRVIRHFWYMALDAPLHVREAVGMHDTLHQEIKSHVEVGNISGAIELLPEALVEYYAIAGSPDECRARISELSPHFDMFMLPINHEPSAVQHLDICADILNNVD